VTEAVISTGDLLVGMDGDFNAVRWRGGHALLNQRMCCLRPRDLVTTEYLALLMPLALRYINDMTNSTTVKHLSSTDLKRLRFPAPGLTEQRDIVDRIELEVSPLDRAAADAREAIALIREYRDSLIADVVTGQVDVSSWVPGPDDLVAEEDLALLDEDKDEATEGGDGDGDD
jgi:type I restriction enzyme, S subunit